MVQTQNSTFKVIWQYSVHACCVKEFEENKRLYRNLWS